MPLRDHFHPPLSRRKNWEGFHGQWPAMVVQTLNQKLPSRFEAEPSVCVEPEIEADVATLEHAGGDDAAASANGDLSYDFALPSLAVET